MKKLVSISFMTAAILAGCGSVDTSPRTIDAETDICEICNMGITSMDYAAQAILSNNDYQVFDDLGCLIEFLQTTDKKVEVAYIKSADTGEWVDVKKATYLYSSNYWTPMNYGVLAFASQEGASQYAKENGEGESVAYDDLLTTFNWGVHTH